MQGVWRIHIYVLWTEVKRSSIQEAVEQLSEVICYNEHTDIPQRDDEV